MFQPSSHGFNLWWIGQIVERIAGLPSIGMCSVGADSWLLTFGFFQRPIIPSIGVAMAVRGKEAAAMLPEPWPDAFVVGLREVQASQRRAREELKAAFAHRWRELLELQLQLEQKHKPVRLSLKAVFAYEAGKVKVRGQKLQSHLLLCLARGADVGRFAEVGLEFATAWAPPASIRFLRSFEQEDFVVLVEAVEQRGDLEMLTKFRIHDKHQ